MPETLMVCRKCAKEHDTNERKNFCECGAVLGELEINITGTRDSFGIGNEFKDEKTGKVIDNFKSWEKAGYASSVDSIKNNRLKEKVKEQITRKKTRQASKLDCHSLPL